MEKEIKSEKEKTSEKKEETKGAEKGKIQKSSENEISNEELASISKKRLTQVETRDILNRQKKTTIIIHKTKTEKDDVFVSINGHRYQMQRGVEIEVPEGVLQVLDDAVQTEYEVIFHKDSVEMIPHDSPRISYRTKR